MTRSTASLLFALIILVSPASSYGGPTADNSGPHTVGFTLREFDDPSRLVGPGTQPQPRPIRIYTWYPAGLDDSNERITFGRYVKLAEDDVWPEQLAGPLRDHLRFARRPLARSLGEVEFRRLLGTVMMAVEDAPPAEGRHELLVLGQGLYYESPIAFAAFAEYLASHGFVIATSPLTGTRSPIARMDVNGLETQVRDLEFVIAKSRELGFVSREQLGVLGFDMGGMAGVVLSMRNRDVDAFASLSSGILYDNPEGIPQDAADFDPSSLQVPWFHSVPEYWIREDGPSLFDKAKHSQRYLLLTRGMGHVDYTSYALIPSRKQINGYWGPATPFVKEAHLRVREYVLQFFNAFIRKDSRAIDFLETDAEILFPGSGMQITSREAEPAPITYEHFVAEVITGNGESAVDRLREIRNTAPEHALLQESHLERLIWSLRDTWGMRERLMPVIRFRAELFPLSLGALHMLAEGQVALDELESAANTYRKILDINPQDQHAQRRLEAIKN